MCVVLLTNTTDFILSFEVHYKKTFNLELNSKSNLTLLTTVKFVNFKAGLFFGKSGV